MLASRSIWLITAACCALCGVSFAPDDGRGERPTGDRRPDDAKRRVARRRGVRRSQHRLGRRRSGRHLAHRATAAESWKQQQSGVTCPTSLGLVRRRPARLDRRRRNAAALERVARRPARRPATAARPGPNSIRPRCRRFTHLRFFDAEHGIAAGDSSALFPSGVFVTQDGGKNWQPLPTDSTGNWLAADFPDARSGAVAGAGGRFATLMRRRVVNSPAGGRRAACLPRTATCASHRWLARGRRRPDHDDERSRRQLADAAGRIARRGARKLRLPSRCCGWDASLDRRFAGHADPALVRRRPLVETRPHGPECTAPRHHVRRRGHWLRRRRSGHDPRPRSTAAAPGKCSAAAASGRRCSSPGARNRRAAGTASANSGRKKAISPR